MDRDFDVVVVGAGPGGALAARDLAREGLKVALFDARSQDQLSKTIIVEIENQVFGPTGVDFPQGEEVPYHGRRTRVFSGRRRHGFYVEGAFPAVSVYLDRFVKKLVQEAIAAGALFIGERRATGPVISEGRVVGVTFQGEKSSEEVRAKLVIDATGFAASLVRELPPEFGIGFEDRPEEIVVAENHFHEIDPDLARAAVAEGRAGDEEVWNRLSVHGNYSTEYSHLSLKQQRAYILIGLKANAGLPSPHGLISKHRTELSFYGKQLYGGRGPIRVRRSLDQLVADGLMVIGEAACQIIPAHGSGVASAMWSGVLAARVGASALKEGRTDAAALWPYCHQYQSGRGAILAGYDVVRLTTEAMTRDQVFALVESGAMDPEDIINGATPNAMSLSLKSLPRRIKGMLVHPGLLPVVARMGSRGGAAGKLYEAYPKTCDPQAVTAWKQKARAIFAPLEERVKNSR